MRGKGIVWISLAFLMALSAVMTIPVRATVASISAVPSVTTASVGDTVTVNINIANAVGVYAWQVRVVFGTALGGSVLQAMSVTEGLFLKSQAPSGTLFIKRIFQDQGYMDVAATAIGTFSGASGSGTLFKIVFNVWDAGLATIDVTNSLLIDPFLSSIPHTEVDATIDCQSSLLTPDRYAELIEKRVDNRHWDISIMGTMFTFYGKTKNRATDMDLLTRVVFEGTKDAEPFLVITNEELVGPLKSSAYMTNTITLDPGVDIGSYMLNVYAQYSFYGHRWYTSELAMTKDLSFIIEP